MAVFCRHPISSGLIVLVVVQSLIILSYMTMKQERVSQPAESDAVSRNVSSVWARRTGDTPPKIFYNRVPKCGSSTLRILTTFMSRINNFTYKHSKEFLHYTINEREQSHLCAELNSLRVPALYNRHVHFVDFTRFKMEMPVYINIIRDPFERMVSWYYFRRFQSVYIEPLPEADVYKSFDSCVLNNDTECTEPNGDTFGFGYFHVIPFFCGQAAFCRTPSRMALERAISNVDRYYSVVGVVEQFEQFVEALEDVFPDYFRGMLQRYKDLGQSNNKINVTRNKIKPTNRVRQIMWEKLKLEYQFYFYVKRRFEKLYKEITLKKSMRTQTKTFV